MVPDWINTEKSFEHTPTGWLENDSQAKMSSRKKLLKDAGKIRMKNGLSFWQG